MKEEHKQEILWEIKDFGEHLYRFAGYIEVLKHREKCSKWGKGFCIECFGGGITRIIKKYNKELIREIEK